MSARACLGVCYALALGSFGVGQSGPATQLLPRTRLSRELKPGQQDIFTVTADLGEYFQIVTLQSGVELTLVLADPSSKAVLTADLTKSVAWIAQVAGNYSLTVSSRKDTGKYEIELVERRPPTETDRARIDAQNQFYEGVAAERKPDRDSRLAAIALYAKSASIFHGIGGTFEEELCLERMSAVYTSLGESAKAIESLKRGLELASDHAMEASFLAKIGSAYQASGELEKSLDAYQRELALERDIGDRAAQARTLWNVGRLYYSLDEQQKAIDTYEQVRSLQNALGNQIGEARALNILGQIYRDLGTDEALDFFERALKIERSLGDRADEADTVMSAGDVYFFMGEKQKSLDAYEQSLAIKRALNDRVGEALALVGIANVLSDLGGRQRRHAPVDRSDMQKALEDYQQALRIGQAQGDAFVQVFSLMGVGVVSSALGDKQKALETIKQAQFLFSIVRYRPAEGWAIYEKARVERDLGQFAAALADASKGRELVESLRTKVVSQELRATFYAAVHDCFTLEMDVLMRMHVADPSKNYQAEALTASERARARILLDTLREANADIRQGVAPELLDRERSVQASLNAKEMMRIQMMGSKQTPQQAAEIEKAVRDLTIQYEQIHTQILQQSPRYAALNFPKPLTVAEIQKEVLDEDTLLLEFALGDERGFLWVVSRSGLESIILPKREDVEDAARALYDGLKDSGASPPEAGKRLSQLLLGEVAPKLGNKRLLIVADGALQYVPFAALPDPAFPDQPLVVNHEIVNAPSASTLAVLRRESSGRKAAPKALAIMADPVFNLDDSRVTSARLAAKSLPADRTIEIHVARLPGTRREAAGIAALIPESERKLALDFDASRATLSSHEMDQYRMLHLATHGLLNSEHPELSGVVLSMVDRQGHKEDGFVRLNEIYNLKLSADLVVLSACQTALGKDIRGEGLVGLTRGFMYAGAPRVVASLWKVDDRATAELMKRFYGAMLGAENLRPAAALRQAEIAMWKTKGWESPHYWAAFTLQGEWK